MDFSWLIIIGSFLVFGYIFFSSSGKGDEALEKRVSILEMKLKQMSQEMDLAEPDINGELRELLRQGKTIEAVKRTRQEFGWSLLEAKQYVDELKADM